MARSMLIRINVGHVYFTKLQIIIPFARVYKTINNELKLVTKKIKKLLRIC